MKFRAAVLHEVGADLAIETVESGPLAPGDVLVRIRAASICHTDLEVITGDLRYPLPMVLGHEAAGTVAEVGADVRHLAPGDPVVLSWNPHCGLCFYCDNDIPILCEPYAANRATGRHFDGGYRLSLGGAPLHVLMYLGGFAEYAVVAANSAVKVPAAMPLDRACLIGCGVMTGVGAATNIAKLKWGETALVIGCGAIGLSAIQGARMAGAAQIVAVDRDSRKLPLAQAVGATHLCDSSAEDPVALAKAITGGRGADVTFEAAGHADAFRLAIEAARPGGQVIWLGKVDVRREVSFNWGTLMPERTIRRSSYGGAKPQQDFPALSNAYLTGALKLDEMITRRIRLDQINDGFAALRKGEAIRTVVEFD